MVTKKTNRNSKNPKDHNNKDSNNNDNKKKKLPKFIPYVAPDKKQKSKTTSRKSNPNPKLILNKKEPTKNFVGFGSQHHHHQQKQFQGQSYPALNTTGLIQQQHEQLHNNQQMNYQNLPDAFDHQLTPSPSPPSHNQNLLVNNFPRPQFAAAQKPGTIFFLKERNVLARRSIQQGASGYTFCRRFSQKYFFSTSQTNCEEINRWLTH